MTDKIVRESIIGKKLERRKYVKLNIEGTKKLKSVTEFARSFATEQLPSSFTFHLSYIHLQQKKRLPRAIFQATPRAGYPIKFSLRLSVSMNLFPFPFSSLLSSPRNASPLHRFHNIPPPHILQKP